MRWVIGIVVVALALGCGRNQPSAGTSTTAGGAATDAPKDEAVALQERLRAGGYQIDAAMGAMERAMNVVRPLAQGKPPETLEALQNIADMLDSAAATIIEFNDAPALDAIRADFRANDDRRLKAIEEANDARREVDQARGIVADLLQSEPPPDVKTQLDQIDDAIEEALDALEEGIEAFGGQVDEPSEDGG